MSKWYETIEYETIERPEMQAMSESHRAWQQQLQQAEMQAQAAAEAQAQRADEPAVFTSHWWMKAEPPQMSDPPQSEKPATDTSAGAVQRRIDDVCQDLVAGRTTSDQRRGLGGAVERAGRVNTDSDAAVGRIARLPR